MGVGVWESGNLIDVGENRCYFTADVMYIQCICICMRDEIELQA